MQLKRRASEINRGLVVIGNRSYGELAVLPVKALLEEQGVPVYVIKVSSSFAGENEVPDIAEMSPDLVRHIASEQPVVAVVDGTRNPDIEGYARYPRAMLGYVNFFSALNEAMGLPTRFGVLSEEQFMRLRGQPGYRTAVERVKQILNGDTSLMTYDIGFWNLEGREGAIGLYYVPTGNFKDKVVPPINVSQVSGPTVVLVCSTVPTSSQIYSTGNLPKGAPHITAYFDDKSWNRIPDIEGKLQQRVRR